MELEGPEVKRIKLEHSYAFEFELNLVGTTQIKEEDPLKLFPEDINVIKSENEDVVIKNEVLEDNANQNFEYFNLPSINEQFENHSESNSSSTLVANEGDICNDVTDCLESVDNCNIVSNTETQPTDPLTLVNNYEETVPKHIFLEFQKRYEKTIVDLASQNTNLVNQLKKLEKENSELNTGLLVSNKDSSHQASFKAKVLQIEVNKLKQELKAAKAKEKLLEMKVHMRGQNDEAINNRIMLQEQVDEDVTLKETYIEEKNDLPRSVRVKEAQCVLFQEQKEAFDEVKQDLIYERANLKKEEKNFELRCSVLTEKLRVLKNYFVRQKCDLSNAKLELVSVKRALAANISARRVITERNVQLYKKLVSFVKNNTTDKIKFEEINTKLCEEKRRVIVLQKLLDNERQKSLDMERKIAAGGRTKNQS